MKTSSTGIMEKPVTGTASVSQPVQEAPGSLLGHLWASVMATVILLIICCAIYPLAVWAIAQGVFPWRANGSLVNKDGAPTTVDTEAVGSALLGQNFGAAQYFHPRPSSAGNGYDAANSSGSNLGPISDKLLNGLVTSTPATPPATEATETLAFDGIRLRAIHYALDNGIAFKLYSVKADADGKVVSKTEVPLSKFQDKDGNVMDIALVKAFPHAGDPADKMPVVADDFAKAIPADAVTASASGLDPHISLENAAMQKARVAKARNISEDAVQKLIEEYTDKPSLGILGDPGVKVLMLNLALDKMAPMPVPATK